MIVRDYLITLARNGRTRRLVWNAREPLPLDHPVRWMIQRTPQGVQALQVNGTMKRGVLKRVPIPAHAILNGTPVALSRADAIDDADADMILTVSPLKPIPPPYARPAEPGYDAPLVEHAYYLYCGLGPHLLSFNRVGATFKVHVEGRILFSYQHRYPGHAVSTYAPGLVLEFRGQSREIAVNRQLALSEEEWTEGRLTWGDHWWRISPIPLTAPDMFDGMLAPDTTDDQRLYPIARAVAAGTLLLMFIVLFSPVRPPRKPREIARTEVRLKEPKLVTKTVPIPPPVPLAAEPPMVIKTAPPVAEAVPAKRKFEDSVGMPERRNAPLKRIPLPEGTEFEVEEPGDFVPNAREVETTGAGNDVPQLETDPNPGPRVNHSNRQSPVTSPRVPGGPVLKVSGAGSLQKEDVEHTLERHLPYFRDCYEKALGKDPKLRGIIQMEWTIGGDGRVTDVQQAASDIKEASLAKCITEELNRITFPRPRGGEVHVVYPLVFQSGF